MSRGNATLRELIKLTHKPGAFADWRRPLEEGGQVWPEMARVAQGIESFAQELKQYTAEGNQPGVVMALEGMLRHQAELLSAVASDEAAEHCLAAAFKIGGKGL